MSGEDGNELRGILTDQVARLLQERSTRQVQEQAETGAWPAALWDALEENGLTRVLVPEDLGGVGGSWLDAYEVLRAAGRFGAPVPLAETVVAGWLLSIAGIEPPAGPLTFGPVRPGEVLSFGGGTLSGTARRVPWGGRAGHAVLVADGRVVLVEGGAAARSGDRNLAAEPRDDLTFDRAEPAAAAALPTDIGGEAALLYGALMRAAQMAGALEGILAMAVQYAGERVQFGRPIGSFQAVQQELAKLAGHAAAADAAAGVACRAADHRDAAFEIAVAKVRCGEAVGPATSIAHQTHGAIGFTYEHGLHHLTRRLWSWRAEFGNETLWAERLGREVAGRGADALWPTLTERSAAQA